MTVPADVSISNRIEAACGFLITTRCPVGRSKLPMFSPMVNPLSKVSLRKELRFYGFWIDRLMHRHRPSVTRSPLMVEHKTMVDGLYVVIGRIAKPLVGKVYRTIKQRITDFLAHARILTQGQGSAYSYFPVVHFIHASTVCLDHANKNVRGASA